MYSKFLCIHTYTWIYIHPCMCTEVCANMTSVSFVTCMHIHMRHMYFKSLCIHIYTWIYIHSYVWTEVCANMKSFSHVFQVLMHPYIYVDIHSFIRVNGSVCKYEIVFTCISSPYASIYILGYTFVHTCDRSVGKYEIVFTCISSPYASIYIRGYTFIHVCARKYVQTWNHFHSWHDSSNRTLWWVMSHMKMRHATHVDDESCHTHTWLSESCHRYGWLMSHWCYYSILVCTRVHEDMHIIWGMHIILKCQWVMSHTHRSHVTHTLHVDMRIISDMQIILKCLIDT